MAHEDKGTSFMRRTHIDSGENFERWMLSQGYWEKSAYQQSRKTLNNLVDLGKLEKGDVYRLPGCKATWTPHTKLTTEIITDILIQYPESIIYREHSIEEIKLRPDVLALLIDNGMGFCAIIEGIINEPPSYLTMKTHTWLQWDGATEYLSKLFGYEIPDFHLIPIRQGEKVCDKFC